MQNDTITIDGEVVNDHEIATQADTTRHLVFAIIDKYVGDLLDETTNKSTNRNRSRALNDFAAWYLNTNQTTFKVGTVEAHITALKKKGVPDSSINQRLGAIKKLALKLANNDVIDETAYAKIKRIENIKRLGKKTGVWLTEDEAKAMIAATDAETLVGKRDRAILSVMLGCGLRREELTTLTTGHLQQRDGRWVILDLEGKHNRVRTVPMASWVKSEIDVWTTAAGIESGFLFPPMRKGGKIQPGNMSPQAIWKVVQRYNPVEEKLAPHDLRRSFAKMAFKNGAPMEQIQFSLGHASIQTTENYVGADIDLQNAPSDFINSLAA